MPPPSATIRDVARLSGVSPMTVSRVINESERVSPDTRRRVEAAIAELGYVPSRLARGLSRRRTGLVVESDEVSTARDRRAGYEAALTAAGIPLDPELVAHATVEPRGGFEGMRRLLDLDRPPTAVFTVNNLVAVGAIEAVRASGLEVPDDVALVCFDDIEYASRLYPFLTAMEQPAQTFGTLGTQLLLERIEGRGPERRHEVVLPGEFIVRKSCGAK